ncbi:TetR/AcrR family transcriptional regulator (plasmid) [Deinococcus sp. KNUC1210]|uniref:TetR/AcrR family transcriptional regulator n=1 Tax=Deinococcus sp. KNUC1210 TaxID=2917691 RepID=UPI001EF11FD4|nr:TetR/AcrR family transcriptional regulator [Deinococcus sp. KNUC1210]ULH17245.1 TetR/AcrR family transcriptional regulator [Deinococcus sp. KNUC1210]
MRPDPVRPDPPALRRDAAENRSRLLSAARVVFAEQGIQAPLEQVSRQAGVGIGTLYRRFPTREALLEALFNEEYHLYIQAADEGLAMSDAWAGFEHYISRICELQGEHGTIREFLSVTPGVSTPLPLHQVLFERAERIVERAKQQGTLRPDVEVGDTALIAWANAEIVKITRRVSPEQWRRHLTLTLDGLRCKSSELAPASLSNEDILKAMRQNV